MMKNFRKLFVRFVCSNLFSDVDRAVAIQSLDPKIAKIGAILAIFRSFAVLRVHMLLFGDFGRSSQD